MRFTGIYTPIITPFKTDFAIDWDAYSEVIEWQIENGVSGIIVGGSTGEFYALSKEERLEQLRFAAERIKGRVELMAGVNDIRADESTKIAVAAREAGATSLLVAAPPYSLPSERELAAHVLNIADASQLPIMLYNYPGRTGVNMGEEFLTSVSGSKSIVAIKESSGDFSRISLIARKYPNIELIVGGEEQVLEFAVWGAKAWVCASANMLPAECVRFLEIVSCEGNFGLGRQLMTAFMPIMSMLERGSAFLQSVKHGCAIQGRPSGTVRPPILPIDETLKSEVGATVMEARDELRKLLAGHKPSQASAA